MERSLSFPKTRPYCMQCNCSCVRNTLISSETLSLSILLASVLAAHATVARSFLFSLKQTTAVPSGRAVLVVCVRQLVCWDCGFEYNRGNGCLSVVGVVCVVK